MGSPAAVRSPAARRARSWARRLRRRAELRPIAALLAIAALVWALAELAGDVLEQDTHAFDTAVLLALRDAGDPSDPLGPPWMHEVGRDLTALGGAAVLTLLTTATMGYLWLRGEGRIGWVLVAGVVGAASLSQVLKAVFDRPRPDLVPYFSYFHAASFPSGHAAMSASTYLVLGMLLARVHRQREVKIYLVLVGALLAVLVGFSRVYVGVHWPTDVLAGWVLGVLWAIAVWTAARWAEDRRAPVDPRARPA